MENTENTNIPDWEFQRREQLNNRLVEGKYSIGNKNKKLVGKAEKIEWEIQLEARFRSRIPNDPFVEVFNLISEPLFIRGLCMSEIIRKVWEEEDSEPAFTYGHDIGGRTWYVNGEKILSNLGEEEPAIAAAKEYLIKNSIPYEGPIVFSWNGCM